MPKVTVQQPAPLPTMTSVLLVTLYFSQGLPAGLSVHVLPPLLREAGVELYWLGFLKLLALPWLLKFLWAPVVDTRSPAVLIGSSAGGRLNQTQRRRAWILSMQCLAIACLIGLSFVDPLHGGWLTGTTILFPLFLVLLILFLNVAAATQDIATDGLAVSWLPPERRGWGNALQVGGYKAGLVLAPAVLLVSIDWVGWRMSLWAMAAALAFCTVLVWIWPRSLQHFHTASLDAPAPAPAPESGGADSGSQLQSGFASYRGLLAQPGIIPWLLIVSGYKLGDALVSPMLKPLLIDQGLGLAEVGGLTGLASLVGTMAVFLGALLYRVLGLWGSLLLFGVLHAGSIVGLTLLLDNASSPLVLWLLIFEQVTDALSTVALFAGMMAWCRTQHEGSDYTLQACLQVLIAGLAGVLSGVLATVLGFEHFLMMAAFAGFVTAIASGWWVRGILQSTGAS